MFKLKDRADAGRRLASLLEPLRGEDPVVIALPRGGVVVGFEIARALEAPLDVLIARKLGAPWQPELGFGAIAEGGVLWLDPIITAQLQLTREEIDRVAEAEEAEAERRARRYRGDRPAIDVAGRTAILVDDGVATGSTARASIRALRARRPRKLVLAAPVAAADTAEELAREVDECVFLETPSDLVAISLWYEEFAQVSDEEVVSLLDARRGGAGGIERPVEVSAGARLFGTLAVPDGARGIVVFAHGSGSGRLSPRNRQVARALHQAGLATLLLDLLTVEEEAIDRATRALRFDIDLLARRLVGAIDWIGRAPRTRDLAVGCFGASTGAAAALIAAAERPDVVRAVVSRGGRPDLAGDALARVSAPTLLVVGGNDQEVIELNREALAALRCERALAIVPGATHLFEEPGALDRVAQLAADWFGRHLGAPTYAGAPADSTR